MQRGFVVFGLSFTVLSKKRQLRENREKARYASLLAPSSSRRKKLSAKERVQQRCIEIAMEVAKSGGEGCLFVIGKTKKYSELFPNFFRNSKTSVLEKGMDKVLGPISQIDGAIVVDPDGMIKAYGVRLTKQSSHQGHGTRHSAAKGISTEKGVIAILASEEDQVVRIFRGGREVVEIDPKKKGVKDNLTKVLDFVNSSDGALAAGTAVAFPFVGPGIILFAGSYYVAKNFLGLGRKN